MGVGPREGHCCDKREPCVYAGGEGIKRKEEGLVQIEQGCVCWEGVRGRFVGEA